MTTPQEVSAALEAAKWLTSEHSFAGESSQKALKVLAAAYLESESSQSESAHHIAKLEYALVKAEQEIARLKEQSNAHRDAQIKAEASLAAVTAERDALNKRFKIINECLLDWEEDHTGGRLSAKIEDQRIHILAIIDRAEKAEADLNSARAGAAKLREALLYCAASLNGRVPESLGKDVVIKEWNKRAQHCWERIRAALNTTEGEWK